MEGQGTLGGQDLTKEMMRLISTAAVFASGIGLGMGALFVAVAALLQAAQP